MAGAPPFDVPIASWPQNAAARSWLITDILPFAIPTVGFAILLPFCIFAAGCCSCMRKGHNPLPRAVGLGCAGISVLCAVALLMWALLEAALLLGTAIELEGTALNATQEASRSTKTEH